MTLLVGELHPDRYGDPAKKMVLAVAGELDLATAPEFQDMLIGAIDSGQTAVDVDMGGVSFCDCRGYAALSKAARYAEVKGCQIRVVNPGRAIRRLFELLGAEEVLDLRCHIDAEGPAA